MDQFVVRTSETAQNREIKQAGVKFKTVQLNCGYKGIAQSHNTRSVELRRYLSTAQPDIVLLQETWLHKDSTVSFPEYAVLRRDRPEDYCAKAGGVATLIRKGAGIKYDKIEEEIAPNDGCFDVLLVKIVWYGHTFILSNIYSPPVSARPTGRSGFTAEHTLTACLHRVRIK